MMKNPKRSGRWLAGACALLVTVPPAIAYATSTLIYFPYSCMCGYANGTGTKNCNFPSGGSCTASGNGQQNGEGATPGWTTRTADTVYGAVNQHVLLQMFKPPPCTGNCGDANVYCSLSSGQSPFSLPVQDYLKADCQNWDAYGIPNLQCVATNLN